MDLSIVIPAYNEEESIPELIDSIKDAIALSILYEIIIIDDGSSDNSWEFIKNQVSKNSFVKGIRFIKNNGKSAALDIGFKHSSGKVVITMDADLQDDPKEILPLYKMIIDEDYDLVSGWKKIRFDPITKTLPSKFFNFVTRLFQESN